MAEEKNPVVIMETSQGTIKIELWNDKAPGTVANFLRYVDDGFYSGTIFHRVIADFMIQGGGMAPDMKEKKTRDPIRNEATPELMNKRGTIAMARTSLIHSATAQFFINVVDNNMLNFPSNGGYAVFGKVVEGMEVVDKIKGVTTRADARLGGDVPVEPVTIKSATVE